MNPLVDLVSKHRLGGEPCPKDLEILITHGSDLLEELGIEINGDPSWAPWTDKSYLTAADYQDPDIAANVKAIDETFAMIRFAARTDQGEFIGYWSGPEGRTAAAGPLVYYDTEGQFRLCGARFIEALFFVSYDEELLARLKHTVAGHGVPLAFESIDEIAIPQANCTPDEFHQERYRKLKET